MTSHVTHARYSTVETVVGWRWWIDIRKHLVSGCIVYTQPKARSRRARVGKIRVLREDLCIYTAIDQGLLQTVVMLRFLWWTEYVSQCYRERKRFGLGRLMISSSTQTRDQLATIMFQVWRWSIYYLVNVDTLEWVLERFLRAVNWAIVQVE